MAVYKTPGVYVEELPGFPPVVTSVETAVPAFIGYTAQVEKDEEGKLLIRPVLIRSLLEFEQRFGGADLIHSEGIDVVTKADVAVSLRRMPVFLMYESVRLYFENGGGKCYIIAVGDYSSECIELAALQNGLNIVKQQDDITLLNFPDALSLPEAAVYYSLCNEALGQCATLRSRLLIMDVYREAADWQDDILSLRTSLTSDTDLLRFGVVYFPALTAAVKLNYAEEDLLLHFGDGTTNTLAEIKNTDASLYDQLVIALQNTTAVLPASPAVCGVYSQVDDSRGVWKAPANINIIGVAGPSVSITSAQQEDLNVDLAGGKSVNVIRSFEGRGNAVIWGARTLAGNDNEWRYVPVRRFFNMVEQSVRHSTEWAVFEPNDANTWMKIRAQLENYLVALWRQGALQGNKPEQAFFVRTGLNETMTAIDIQEGRLTIEIGLAVVRPAEFVIFRLSRTMQEPH